MKPYQTIKLIEYPDIADIKSDGRKSSVGRVDDGRDYHGYCRSKHKKISRRHMKRSDKARSRKNFED
jgi:hypothetical protein